MQENLVIVESPAKAKTIEKFLGSDYKVMSSYGHIRDLKKKEISIDKDTLQPAYVIPKDKEELVKKLYTDKKVRDGKLRFVLQKGIGATVEFAPGVYAKPIEESLAREIIMEL